MFIIKSLNTKFSKDQNSRPEVTYKKIILQIKILRNSLKSIGDAVFNLMKFQAKGMQHY